LIRGKGRAKISGERRSEPNQVVRYTPRLSLQISGLQVLFAEVSPLYKGKGVLFPLKGVLF